MSIDRRSIVLTIALVFSLAHVLHGEPSRQPLLVEPEQLQDSLNGIEIRILDTRSEEAFEQGHIPGAARVDVSDWKQLAASDHGLFDDQGWSEKLSPLGITTDSKVVVYGDRVSDSARIWWLLKYLGVEQASLLNSSWEAWVDSGFPVDQETASIDASEFRPRFQPQRVVPMTKLVSNLQSDEIRLVDTRSITEFEGGRIPGAAHLEWTELLTPNQRFKTKMQLQQLFRDRGITPNGAAICYCHSGGRACVDAFALELAGYPEVKVYVRGWSEWGTDDGAPKEK